jgi:Icc protein
VCGEVRESSLSVSTLSTIRLLQLTDFHLGEQQGYVLAGMETNASLQAVLAEVPEDEFDLIVVTGDLAENGNLSAYGRLKNYLADTFEQPCFYLPGNHDDKEVMGKVLGNNGELIKVFRKGNWQLLFLDSSVHNQIEGFIDEQELDFIRRQLNEHSEFFTLLAVHHPFVSVGCEWLDEQKISNAETLISLVESFSQIKVVISGHVHQVFETQIAQAKVMTAPSTSIQFAPNHQDFKVDDQQPGWRSIELYVDGRVESNVCRLRNHTLAVDLEFGGYL